MNKPDVTLNYITLVGVGAVIYFVGYAIAGFRTRTEYKRAQKRHS